jgi:hypothetical protein
VGGGEVFLRREARREGGMEEGTGRGCHLERMYSDSSKPDGERGKA